MQSGDGYGDGTGTCNVATLPSRLEAITTECCDEPAEDCSGGYPQACNPACAAVFLPFWASCRSALGETSWQLKPTVALCEAAALAGDSGAAWRNS
eukprot:COSAG06_NODE_6623_length_2852_cov_4.446785_2_plen_96_part_00